MSTSVSSKSSASTNGGFSLSRFRVLLRGHLKILIVCTLAVAGLNLLQTLSDVPLYTSVAKLQLQTFDVGKSVDDRASVANDVLNESIRLSNAVLLFKSAKFLEILAKELQNLADRDHLVLTWGIGRRLKVSYALYRLGFKNVQFDRINLSTLSTEELGILLNTMIQVTSTPVEETIDIRVSALEEKTAYLINRAVINAFFTTNEEIDRYDLERSLKFLHEQVGNAKARLEESEDKLVEYTRNHPNVTTDAVASSFLTDFLTARTKKQDLEKSIQANRDLLAYFRTKMETVDANGESKSQVLEALQGELTELRYQRAKLLEQGYAPNHPGLTTLDRKIASSEDFIQKSQAQTQAGPDAIYGLTNYRKDLANNIIHVQDAIAKQEGEMKGLSSKLRELEAEVDSLPSSEREITSLKRDVTQNSEMAGELTRRLELTSMRSQASKSSLREVTAPNVNTAPLEIPFWPRIFFGFLAGMLLGVCVVALMDVMNPRLAIREDIEAAGFRYAGHYLATPDSCAEVLAAMECIFRKDGSNGRTPVVLIGSASPALTLHSFMPMIDYMASRNEKVLLIAEDQTILPNAGKPERIMEGIEVHRHPNGNRDIIQISGAERFGVIKMLLSEFEEEYQAIFLFVSKGSTSSAYSLCRALANRILIFGEEGKHTFETYRNLTANFPDPSQIYTALLPNRAATAVKKLGAKDSNKTA